MEELRAVIERVEKLIKERPPSQEPVVDPKRWLRERGVPESILCNWSVELTVDQAGAMKRGISPGGCVLLSGDVGRGKTHLACRLAAAWAYENESTFTFANAPSLFEALRLSYGRTGQASDRDEDGVRWFGRMRRAPLVVLDDLGAERVTDWVEERLYLIVNSRSDGMLPMIVTSNLGRDELSNRLGKRVWSRLEGMMMRGGVKVLKGKDMRS